MVEVPEAPEPQPEPEPEPEPAPEPEPEPERAVASLESLVPEVIVIEPELEAVPDIATGLDIDFADLGLELLAEEPEPEIDEVVEPMSMQAVPFVEVPVGETVEIEIPDLEIGEVEIANLIIPEAEESEEAEPAIVIDLDAEALAAGIAPAGSPDFVSIMESLDQLVEESVGPNPVEAGFDADILADDETPAAGVISTSDYLEDIAIDGGLGSSTGLGDELSALTGAKRHRPGRPTASVNHIPELGVAKIGLDRRVDKDTLLKIIDGIKNL